MNQKGSLIVYLILVITLLLIGGTAYYFFLNRNTPIEKQLPVSNPSTASSSALPVSPAKNSQEIVAQALKNFEQVSTFTINMFSKSSVKMDNHVRVELESKGESVGDHTKLAERSHVDFKGINPPGFDGSTDDIVFYKENLIFSKRPTSQNRWVILNLKKFSSTRLPPGLTIKLVKSIIPSTLKVNSASDESTYLTADINPSLYFADYDLYKKDSTLYKNTQIAVSIWIDTRTNQLTKINYKVENEPYSAGIAYGELIDSDATLTYAQFNQPVTIEKPTDNIITLEELKMSDPAAASIMQKEADNISAAY